MLLELGWMSAASCALHGALGQLRGQWLREHSEDDQSKNTPQQPERGVGAAAELARSDSLSATLDV